MFVSPISDEILSSSVFEDNLSFRILNLEGRHIHVSRRFCEFFHIKKEEILQESNYNYFDELQCPLDVIRNVSTTLQSHEYEISLVSPTESNIFLKVTSFPLFGNTNTCKGVIQYFSDISRYKKHLIHLEQSQQQLRNLSQHLQITNDKQNKMLGRKLHDSLSQSLSVLSLFLHHMNSQFAKTDESYLKQTEQMQKLIEQSAEQTREISQSLGPKLIDDLGITAAIEWYLNQIRKQTSINFHLLSEPEDIFVEDLLGLSLFQVIKTLIDNVIEHSNASQADICLEKLPDFIHIQFQDNGCGINPAQLSVPDSIGLAGVRERILYFNGSLTIEGKPNSGTKVLIHIPLKRH